uniref:G_PROTEIN_RECEP_F1_2 domain-containing protein n=1 Tax=Steinernema glaseri TaxID=37863 RepID=A0A1I8A1L6_9BILA
MSLSVVDGHYFVGDVDYCELGKRMSENVYYRTLMGFKIVVCLVGIFLCSCLLISKVKSVIMHIHARILLHYHIIVTLVLTCNYLWISIFETIRHSRTEHPTVPCNYVMPRWLTFFPHFITGNMIYCQILSCFFITVERLICTCKIRTYENTNYKWTLVTALVVMTLTVLLCSYLVLGRTASWEIRLFYFSFRDTTNHVYGTGFVVGQFLCDLVTVTLCKIVDIINRRTRRSFVHGSFCGNSDYISTQLTSKLQIRENIAVSQTLLPVVGVHWLLTAFSTFVISILMLTLRHNILLSVIVAESCALFPLYSSIMPILIFRKHPSLFWALTDKVLGRKREEESIVKTDAEEFERHFKWFDQMLEYKKVPTRL